MSLDQAHIFVLCLWDNTSYSVFPSIFCYFVNTVPCLDVSLIILHYLMMFWSGWAIISTTFPQMFDFWEICFSNPGASFGFSVGPARGLRTNEIFVQFSFRGIFFLSWWGSFRKMWVWFCSGLYCWDLTCGSGKGGTNIQTWWIRVDWPGFCSQLFPILDW